MVNKCVCGHGCKFHLNKGLCLIPSCFCNKYCEKLESIMESDIEKIKVAED